MSEAATAKHLTLSVRTLQRYRAAGTGPAAKRIGVRRIAYAVSDVAAWVAAQQQ